MKKVELREDELKKYTTIKKLVETGGNKKKAATKLNCSLRTIDRMIVRYKNQGKAGFIHGNRGKMPSTTYFLKKQKIKLLIFILMNI